MIRICKHEFNYIVDMVNTGEKGSGRVKCPCHKCGKVFYAHCGIDLSDYGRLVMTKPLNELLDEKIAGEK